MRSLTAFYLSVDSFAAASLASPVAAIGAVINESWLHQVGLSIASVAGVLGIFALVSGSALLVWESQLAFRILRDETKFLQEQVPRFPERPLQGLSFV